MIQELEFFFRQPVAVQVAVAVPLYVWASVLIATLTMRWQGSFARLLNFLGFVPLDSEGMDEAPVFNGMNFASRFLTWPVMITFWSGVLAVSALIFLIASVFYTLSDAGDAIVRAVMPDLYQRDAEEDSVVTGTECPPRPPMPLNRRPQRIPIPSFLTDDE